MLCISSNDLSRQSGSYKNICEFYICDFYKGKKAKGKCQLVYKPGSVWRNLIKNSAWQPFIWYGCYHPSRATYPNDRPGNRLQAKLACHSYSVLLPVGFTLPHPLLDARWALTPPFHPYLHEQAVYFCGTFPEVTLAGRYPAPLFHGARTFLTFHLSVLRRRGCPTNWRAAYKTKTNACKPLKIASLTPPSPSRFRKENRAIFEKSLQK